MKTYAQINGNNICIGISQLSGGVKAKDMIEVPDMDTDYIWRKYEKGTWSAEKYEPVSTAPIDEFQALKAAVDQLVMDVLR